jgi:predicted RNA polymerase sigma factor
MGELGRPSGRGAEEPNDAQDQLALIFLCCHPALDPEVRVALTPRAVCGLSTTEIAATLLLPEPTLAKRLVRARRKIAQTGMRLTVPNSEASPERLAGVLRVVYLVFAEGHRANTGVALVREQLCDAAVGLARHLATLLPHDPEVLGLLALLLLTDARREARTDEAGDVVLLAEQDRTRYDTVLVAEGETLLERALRHGRPGPYQVQAAVAACHSTAARAVDTDWREIAALYGELLRYEPSPVTKPTGPSRWPWPKDRRPGWSSSTPSPTTPSSPAGPPSRSPEPTCCNASGAHQTPSRRIRPPCDSTPAPRNEPSSTDGSPSWRATDGPSSRAAGCQP